MRSFLLALSLWSGIALAAPMSQGRTVEFEPCRWWQYDFNSNGYNCRSTAFRVRVYDSRETDQLIGRLERRIQELENRVKALEGAAATQSALTDVTSFLVQ